MICSWSQSPCFSHIIFDVGDYRIFPSEVYQLAGYFYLWIIGSIYLLTLECFVRSWCASPPPPGTQEIMDKLKIIDTKSFSPPAYERCLRSLEQG